MSGKRKTRTRPLPEIARLSKKAADPEKSTTAHISPADHGKDGEAWYQLMFNSVSETILVCLMGDRETMTPGKFIEVNDVACRRLGYTREELLRMTPLDIDAPETTGGIPAMAIMTGIRGT